MPRSERESYHHGDARNALLAAADGLLREVGAANLSLRGIAERAGLSRQAPYNHFADKEAILAALALDGYRRMSVAVEAARDEGLPPRERLRIVAATYMRFAMGNPALFRLMFSSELIDLQRRVVADEGYQSAFLLLNEIIAGLAGPNGAGDLTLAAWSLVHGYSTLCLEAGIEGPERIDERAAQFAAILTPGA